LVDQEKIGKPWSDDELDVIVADYFSMLGSELARQPYVKSHHSAALMEQIGRTHRSVEFKHQNISAVLEELGLPWIQGYKPKRNYQAAIFDAIDRYLSTHETVVQDALPRQLPSTVGADIFVTTPAASEKIERPPPLERLVRKFDPIERDFRNRRLGKAGELFVIEVERQRLNRLDREDLSRKIRRISDEDGDGAGYDVLSFEPNGKERLIEVKTTNGSSKTPFFLTRTEMAVASERPDAWNLYRVHLFAQSPRIFTLRPPLEDSVYLRAEAWRASFE
jgi:hypothetical protein